MMNIVIALVFILSTISLYAGNYTVDRAHSKVGFKIKYIVVSSVAGRFTSLTLFSDTMKKERFSNHYAGQQVPVRSIPKTINAISI